MIEEGRQLENPNNDDRSKYLNFGEEDQMEICGYTKNSLANFLVWVLYIVTLGMLRLVFHWYPNWQLIATHRKCNLRDAQKVLITDKFQGSFKSFFVEKIDHLSIENFINLKKNDLELRQQLMALKDSHLDVYLTNGTQLNAISITLLYCKRVCYVWHETEQTFIKLSGIEKALTCEQLHLFTGQSKEEQLLRRIVYGKNEIQVPRDSIFKLFILETLNPFYIFQLFTIVVWLLEYYYYYTVAILIMSAFGISSSILQTRQNQKNLHGTVQSTDKIKVFRGDGNEEFLDSCDLVPGDVIALPCNGCTMTCDAVLLSGNCIVNESMLTGESVPVTKTPIPKMSVRYDSKEDAKHTLFSGTKVIQTRYYGGNEVKAIVIRTGYLTSKGQLIRSIMYPSPADFKFDQDSYKFIIILAVICAFGLVYTVVSKYSRNNSAWDITIKALDLITIAIPPALPAAMTVGKLYALNRLKKAQIFCVNSRVINVSGSINCVCFDKTGTLTEDGLDLWGVITTDGKLVKEILQLKSDEHLFRALLTCHSLTTIDGQLIGDPLDLKMFESTKWYLEEPQILDSSKYDLLVPTIVKPSPTSSPLQESYNETVPEIGILRQFQFSSSLQRMSVIVKSITGGDSSSSAFQVYCKGSPEIIASLCNPATVPETFVEDLRVNTEQGYRVIALATKTLPPHTNYLRIQKISRDEVETELNFVGLLVLENRLKPQTVQVIKTLQDAAVKTVMITGDNLQTAVSVARECNIIRLDDDIVEIIATVTCDASGNPHQKTVHISTKKAMQNVAENGLSKEQLSKSLFRSRNTLVVISGNTWQAIRDHHPSLLPKIVSLGAVFARMTSDQKQQVIFELQRLGYFVAMCGDGANDCGALKAAHVGISLSEAAESSIASPFVSRRANVSCVPQVIREGRAALITSFGVFKFMICYSLTEFSSCIILYGIDNNLTSSQFLFIDICLVLNFAFFFGKTDANKTLFKDTKPQTTLLDFVPISSMVFNLFLAILFQIISYHLIFTFDWFRPFIPDVNDTMYFTSYENYAVFTVSMFQYVIMAIVFSKGKPHRKPIYTNYLLSASILLMTVFCVCITIFTMPFVTEILNLQMPPDHEAAFLILGLAAVNFVLALIAEGIVVDILLADKIVPYFLKRYYSKQKKYDKSGNIFDTIECETTKL